MGQILFSGATRAPRLAAFLACGAAALVLAISTTARAQPKPGGQVDPSEELYHLGFKFQAASSCSNVKCHGGAERHLGADYKDNSFSQWNKEDAPDAPADPHRTSFKKLRGPLAQSIAKGLKLASATTDAKCLACHTINPPANLLEGQPLLSEGVTCNGCHGPSGTAVAGGGKGWVDLHTVRGWHEEQRKGKHEDTLKKFGFYDTKPLIERASRCVSCHLAIDPKMVAAGHPQPTFELNWFSVTYSNRHWDDPTDKYFGAQLWAAGQVVALRDAFKQVADRADADAAGADDVNVTAAYNEAFAHYTVFRPLADTIKADLSGVTAQLTAANKSLKGAANRKALATAARAGADAAAKLFPAVQAWVPDKTTTMAVLKTVVNQGTTADTLGFFGIEQQRDAIFALYNAYVGSAEGTADKAASDTRDFIGQKLFPTDATGLIPSAKLPAAQYKAALAEVKAKLAM